MPTLLLSVSGARGIVGDGLDEGVAFRLSRAFVEVVGGGPIVMGRDSRLSGPRIARAAAAGLIGSGCEVQDLGIVPTPTVQVAVEGAKPRGGVVVSASHNPSEWNALKFLGPQGRFLTASQMERLVEAFRSLSESERPDPDRPAPAVGRSPSTRLGEKAIAQHVAQILRVVDAARIRTAGVKVMVDAVHGAGAVLIEPLLAALGVSAGWIAREPDGALPPHPEPSAERLQPLREEVRAQGAQVGFALDPDADRCALVLPEKVLGEEWSLPLAALTRLRRGARGPLVTNLSTTSRMDHLAERFGVPLLRTPVGEAHVVGRMQEAGAVFGGEGNGGVIDPQVHLGRDSGVAVALLLELEVGGSRAGSCGGIRSAVEDFPARAMVKRKIVLEENKRSALMTHLCERLGVPDSQEDGLRWTRGDAWLHVRPSGTEPVVRAIAEAGREESARRLTEAVSEVARGLGRG